MRDIRPPFPQSPRAERRRAPSAESRRSLAGDEVGPYLSGVFDQGGPAVASADSHANSQERERLAAALAGHYTLERQLGRGGMATVYLAHDLRHDRPVALKVLHPELASALGPERFQREIRFAARLQHPHILTVLDSGDAAGQLWFTMPYVEGESLRDRLNRERQLPVDDALRIAREAADALDYAHAHGVIHRDVKPENILLTGSHALVADFGIARALAPGAPGEQLTATGLSVGTAAYMSPEQAAGEREVDARSDVYSLGTVLYEMLAGETPFAAPTPQATIARRFTEAPRPVRQLRESVPEGVERAVQRALARTAADRFATAADFARALAVVPSAAPPSAGLAAAASGAVTAPCRPWRGGRSSRRWCWASPSARACSSPGAGTSSRPRRTGPRGSPCCRSRTWATRPTPTSPTASPTRCEGISPGSPGCG